MKKIFILICALFLLPINIIYGDTKGNELVYEKDGIKEMKEYNGSVNVKIYYYNNQGGKDPKIVLYKGFSKDENKVKITDYKSGKEGDKLFIEKKLNAGLYYFEVYFSGSSDYVKKHFYIDGSEGSISFDLGLSEFEVYNNQENVVNMTTDQVINNFYNYENIKDELKEELVTPSFTMEKYTNNVRYFMDNTDLCNFVDNLECDYLYKFYPFEVSPMGNDTPVLVFTKDNYDKDISFERLTKLIQVNANNRNILLINGGQHGNEPAGIEGALQFAVDMCTDYGYDILDNYSAIVIIPCLSVDNNQRFSRTYSDGCNSNRDLLHLEHEGSQNFAYIYNLLKPTVYISCHEDNAYNTVDPTDNSIADIHGLSFDTLLTANSPIINTNAMANGSESIKDNVSYKMFNNVVEKAREDGFITEHYPIPSYYGCCETAYSMIRGSFSFLIEVTRIWSGKANYAYAVNELTYGIKTIINEVNAQGNLAELSKKGREEAAVNNQKDMTYFVLKMAKQVQGEDIYPSVYVNGTYKDEFFTKKWKTYSEIKSTRSLPISYVIPTDLENIDKVLNLLDMHGITYNYLKEGTVRNLKKYIITEDELGAKNPNVSIEKNADVTFENGAYEIPLNNSDAYLIGYLFEPDSYVDTNNNFYNSLYEMEYIKKGEGLYRNDNDSSIGYQYDIDAYFDNDMPEFIVNTKTINSNSFIDIENIENDSILDFKINHYQDNKLIDNYDNKINISVDISNLEEKNLTIKKVVDGKLTNVSNKIKDGYLTFDINSNGEYRIVKSNNVIWYVLGGVGACILTAGGMLLKKKNKKQ